MKIDIPLSIAIPAYNRANSVQKLLGAIVAQSLPEDDILVSDDASIYEIEDVGAQYPSVRFVHHPINVGMVRNWNTCLEHAERDWICIIHDDDSLEPGGLDVLRRVCAKINEPALILPTIRQVECDDSFRYSFCAPGRWPVLHCPSIPSGAIIHREIITKLGVFNPRFCYSSDLEYFPRVVAHYPLIIIESPLAVRYNLHDSNYQVRTWKKADFVAQLEEIYRLVASYAQMEGSTAELLVQQRLTESLEYVLKEACRRHDDALIRQYKPLLEKRRYLDTKTSVQRFAHVLKKIFRVF